MIQVCWKIIEKQINPLKRQIRHYNNHNHEMMIQDQSHTTIVDFREQEATENFTRSSAYVKENHNHTLVTTILGII